MIKVSLMSIFDENWDFNVECCVDIVNYMLLGLCVNRSVVIDEADCALDCD